MLYATIMVGAPGSGKSTWVEDHLALFPETKVISRDTIILELAKTSDYNKAWKIVDQKEVDKILKQRFNEVNGKDSFIIDMTNMSIKSRSKWINQIDKDLYTVSCTAFEASKETLMERNAQRNGKNLNEEVIDRMLTAYERPTLKEGFESIVMKIG